MARVIASIPFWMLSAAFMFAAVLWTFDKKATHSASARGMMWGLIISGFFAAIAALVMG